MSHLALGRADAAAAGPPTAAELAARIPVPRRLPERYLSWVGFRTPFVFWGCCR
jgi:hypothetical protein